MEGLCLNMNILVPNINPCGQKDSSFEVRHKAYASRLVSCKSATSQRAVLLTDS